ncbi:ABC transporter ATP-binding protein/permease [[Bacteroides] pectinophilus]|uniref:ABC transporter ATP-binding protein n=1 Tax=[Bacteroides] pectinophilus ATCC 43243 TaxID=483218 RepID=B7AQX1_9FIRM|nr:putative thiol reductant ABC exporter, CydC subunit [[Bacteroides] pectinophilus ATCC 43243]UWN96692.1 ABC transporter ATP-binding protein/permease [[Bacteroides] pectinophilus]
MNKSNVRQKSAISIMASLIVLVKPLLHIMLMAVILGVAGYLCAIFITVLAAGVLAYGASVHIFILMIVIAVMRGVLHYAEQYCNHFIAFKLLAIIRHKVFAVLRKLCPAKLEGRDRGNLISIITTDIELLEVFYAHTISPIAIAVITSIIMTAYIANIYMPAGILAMCAYIIVGAVLPLLFGRAGADTGMQFRNDFGELNSYVLDSLRGLDETIQYGCEKKRREEMDNRALRLAGMQKKLSNIEGRQRSVTNAAVLLASFAMLFLMSDAAASHAVGREEVLVCTAAMMSSFGPVVALANLSNNLHHTLASGERVLSLLEESPETEEITDGCDIAGFGGVSCNDVTFAYDDRDILRNFSVSFQPGRMIGIHGASGCGKSTLLRLIMRFWDVKSGSIDISGNDVRNINTNSLRDNQSFVTQDTYIFNDTIAANIAVAKPDASREEITEAAKKASVHDFIMSLPDNYDSKTGELGGALSGGERQRLGIARAFLHDAPLMLLDEPTSNLDSLNEGIILKSLRESSDGKTIIMVSHRESTLNIADEIVEM